MRRLFKVVLLASLVCLAAQPVLATDARVLAFGDSVTVGHGDDNILCPDNAGFAGYPPRLRQSLLNRGIDTQILNFGSCGEPTAVGVSRIDSVLSNGGDAIIIMEGTNDVSMLVGFETTVFNLNSMAQKALDAEVFPVVAAPVPRGPDAERDANNGKTNRIRLRLEEEAQENNWVFANTFSPLYDLPDFFELHYFDTLHPGPSGYEIIAEALIDPTLEALTRENPCAQVPTGPCVESDTVLCLNNGRFRLTGVWEDFEGRTGVGTTVPQTDDSGAFFWFDPNNIELMVKVLDGRQDNGFFWVFYGALSNVKFSLIVVDTETGECREYFNPLGTFASVGDTSAFFEPPFGDP